MFVLSHTAISESYTLSLHDALPIWPEPGWQRQGQRRRLRDRNFERVTGKRDRWRLGQDPQRHRRVYRRHLHQWRQRSEEHTSELQSLRHLVCRLLLEKNNTAVT